MWNGRERRKGRGISDDEFEAIAKRAAQIVEDSFYQAIGKRVVRLFLLACGAAAAGAYLVFTWVQKAVA